MLLSGEKIRAEAFPKLSEQPTPTEHVLQTYYSTPWGKIHVTLPFVHRRKLRHRLCNLPKAYNEKHQALDTSVTIWHHLLRFLFFNSLIGKSPNARISALGFELFVTYHPLTLERYQTICLSVPFIKWGPRVVGFLWINTWKPPTLMLGT